MCAIRQPPLACSPTEACQDHLKTSPPGHHSDICFGDDIDRDRYAGWHATMHVMKPRRSSLGRHTMFRLSNRGRAMNHVDRAQSSVDLCWRQCMMNPSDVAEHFVELCESASPSFDSLKGRSRAIAPSLQSSQWRHSFRVQLDPCCRDSPWRTLTPWKASQQHLKCPQSSDTPSNPTIVVILQGESTHA